MTELSEQKNLYKRFEGNLKEQLDREILIGRHLYEERQKLIDEGKAKYHTKLGGTLEEKKSKTNYKVIRSGHIVEVYKYQYGVSVGNKKGGRKKGVKSERYTQTRAETLVKNRNVIRRLINQNFNTNAKFVTLTFRDTDQFDIRSLKDCNRLFAKFIMRMRYKLELEFKYVAVPEFQDKYGRGAVHYHIVMDTPFIPWEEIAETWGHGFIGIEAIEFSDNIGAYMAKYITKKSDDIRYEGQKSYFTSRGLNRPTTTFCNSVGELLDDIAEKKAVYSNKYGSDYLGQVDYLEFNLQR